MNLNEHHDQAIKWMEKSINLIDGKDFETTLTSRVAVSLLHLSMEHSKAICVLVGTDQTHGSALALLRPQFEALVRGLWMGRCASEEDANLFVKGKELKRIGKLILDIQNTDGYKNGTLMRQKGGLWDTLNDYTHNGAIQVKARNVGAEIKCNYSDEHIAWLLEISSKFSLLAAIEITRIAEDADLASNLIKAFKLIYAGYDEHEQL